MADFRDCVTATVLTLTVGVACSGSEAAEPERRPCPPDERLVPSCGAWWGIAPGIFTSAAPAQALRQAERAMGRRADIMHTYHRGGEIFPTAEEVELAQEGPRILLINWKPDLKRSWREIADGAVDRRIDRLADHITRTFKDRFFLTIHHEPENDVGSSPGFLARDYRAMYRHVVKRLRSRGVHNAVTVMTYMAAPNWGSRSWFDRLYPGDDVVDWIGADPYADRRVRDFASLVDKRRPDFPEWPGFYHWYERNHGKKPLMISEWGVFERDENPDFRGEFYRSVRRQIAGYPKIKALIYFDSPHAPRGDTRFDTTPHATAEFRRLATIPHHTRPKVP